VVAVGQPAFAVAATIDGDGAECLEFLERPVDGVDTVLVEPAGQAGGAAGHADAAGGAVAQEDDVEPEGAVADVRGDDPLGDDREALRFDDEGSVDCTVLGHGMQAGGRPHG